MTVYNVMKLFHVVAAVVFVGGLFARQAVRAYARKADDVVWFANLSKAAMRIEDLMVKPGSIVVLVLGIIQAWLGGIPIFGFLSSGDQNWLLVSMILYFGVFALVPAVFIPKGKAMQTVLTDALSQGRITTELRAAMDDRAVTMAHRFEEFATLAVLVLMVLKPF